VPKILTLPTGRQEVPKILKVKILSSQNSIFERKGFFYYCGFVIDERLPESHICNPVSHICHPVSDESHPASDERHSESDERHSESDESHPASDERHSESDERHSESDETHPANVFGLMHYLKSET